MCFHFLENLYARGSAKINQNVKFYSSIPLKLAFMHAQQFGYKFQFVVVASVHIFNKKLKQFS